MEVAERTLELLKRMHGEFVDFRRAMESLDARVSSLEQHVAAVVGDIAQIRGELSGIRGDVAIIKRRLDLVEV
jgi:hypothetical protein